MHSILKIVLPDLNNGIILGSSLLGDTKQVLKLLVPFLL